MSRLGLDYGTTNTVAVCSDRGRYPVVPHIAETAVGPVASEVFPSLVVFDAESGRFLFGFDAERSLAHPDAPSRFRLLPSLKRLLGAYVEAEPMAGETVPGGLDVPAVLGAVAQAVRASVDRSGLFPEDEPLETVLTWPANANGAQRYLTRRCFREAGFNVIGTLNEPTAAAIEFADRITMGSRIQARRLDMTVAVFDLGGGTLDVSLVAIRGHEYNVIASSGIERLGGDDFDQILASLFARKLGVPDEAMTPFQRTRLLLAARQQKESISTGVVRSLTFTPAEAGLEGPACSVAVSTYFGELRRLLVPAIEKIAELVDASSARGDAATPRALDAVYLVGGASRLPLVPAMVSQRFPGVKLVHSDKPFTATAMGAAIHSAENPPVRDILSRTFGVMRLAEHGTREFFDPIFVAGTPLPPRGAPPIERRIEYAPRHNIGHLRYVECGALDREARPLGTLRRWSDALFPYDPQIGVGARLSPDQIVDRPDLAGHSVTESYWCDADGIVTAKVTRGCDGRSCVYEVFRP